MAPSKASSLEFPQEIIDKIIDHVAYQSYSNDFEESIPLDLDTLKSCALVSRAFNSRSRWHIFSGIEFTVDKHAQKRATRLVKILHRKDNRALLSEDIRTFKYMFDVQHTVTPTPIILRKLARPFTRSRNFIFRNLENRGLIQNRVHQVFDTMAEASLTHFTFGARNGFLRWHSRRDFDDRFVRLISKPTLESLRISNVMCIPQELVQSALYSSNLRELVLCNIVTIQRTDPLAASDKGVPQPILAKLERLELRRPSYTDLFSIMQNGSATAPSFPTFSHLRTLVVTVPKYPGEVGSLWEIMQRAAPSLETLDIHHNGFPAISNTGPLTLRPFSSLRHLHYTSSVYTPGGDFEPMQRSLANLLSSATSPTLLESLLITFYIQSGSPVEQPIVLSPGNGWILLDDELANRTFVHLKSITCEVKTFHQDITLHSTQKSERAVENIDPSFLFPRMTASPLVDIGVSWQMISNPKNMFTYMLGF